MGGQVVERFARNDAPPGLGIGDEAAIVYAMRNLFYGDTKPVIGIFEVWRDARARCRARHFDLVTPRAAA